MNRILSVTCILALGVLLAGCPKKPTTVAPATGETVGSTTGATTGGANGNTGDAGRPLNGASSMNGQFPPGLETVIRFEDDSSEIRADYTATIAAHGKRLAADRSLKVRLEGHTDERGSAEYNVALGERRAQAVKRALLLQGATDDQLSTVSYGEERPVAEGHDEAAWSQNRRVELVAAGGR